MVPIGLNDLTASDYFWLSQEAKDYEGGETVLKNVASGLWQMWRIVGDAQGILVSYISDGRYFVYALLGEGIHAKQVKAIAAILAKVAKQLGLKGLACKCHSLALAKLYLSIPGGRIVDINLEVDL